jgi:hypothetical protein
MGPTDSTDEVVVVRERAGARLAVIVDILLEPRTTQAKIEAARYGLTARVR